ncbi:hypothetical protein GF402_01220 [Candidatus Fermentibacteria bacterium]|nr:hypothetical protein [Candidatus Fermentibacteria bacterium]
MTGSFMLLALVCAIFAAGTAAVEVKCYFQGSVTWQNPCDYAVVELVNENSLTLYDTLTTSGNIYSFWDATGNYP